MGAIRTKAHETRTIFFIAFLLPMNLMARIMPIGFPDRTEEKVNLNDGIVLN
jgi:hypothetical protein